MTVAVSLATISGSNVNAQSIETMSGQSKVANPQIMVGGNGILVNEDTKMGIAVNEDTNKIYVYIPTSGIVSVIDSNSGTVKNIHVGGYSTLYRIPRQDPTAVIAIDNSDNKIYVANAVSNTVSVIDGDNDTVIAQVKV